ncbi:MAG: YrdB family protein [Candidatus Nanopelagicales bacterium]
MLPVVLAIRFALELTLLGVYFAWGYSIVGGGVVGVLAGIGMAVLVAVVWGVFLSPKARVALHPAVRTALEILVFVGAAVGLAALGHPGWGVALVVADVAVLGSLAVLGGQRGQMT